MLSVASPPRFPVEIGYVTDVEGNLNYFDRWVERSEVLRYTSPGRLELTHPGAHFVFGGDAMDRGDGGLRTAMGLELLRSLLLSHTHDFESHRQASYGGSSTSSDASRTASRCS